MLETMTGLLGTEAGFPLASFIADLKSYVLIFAGFSLVIFFHELGHFTAAKLCGVRVDKFAVGFGRELFGFTRGETRYAFNILPLGGYVKMLGQDDFELDKSGELRVKDDPRAFTHKPIGMRMFIVSSGVIMNLVFAALVFMLVFMVGVEFPPAVIGLIEPESPADRAGLQVGDKIIKVNNEKVTDYADLKPAVMLSEPDEPMQITIERPDPAGGEPTIQIVELQPEKSLDQTFLKIGVMPLLNNKIGFAPENPAFPPDQQLKTDDEILEVNGQKVSTLFEIFDSMIREKGQWVNIKVRRPAPDAGSKDTELTVKRRAHLIFRPTGVPYRDSGHLLGLVPRREITIVNPGSRADIAPPREITRTNAGKLAELVGLQPGDVVVRWERQIAPRLDEILDSIVNNPERDIRVAVLRQSADQQSRILHFHVRPKSSGLLFKSKPMVGIELGAQENERLIVSDIITHVTEDIQTPAAKLKGVMPRGSLITKVDGEPVKTWYDLTERFIEVAGTEVELCWSYEGQPEQTETIYIPQTLGTVFDLPPWHKITKINGEKTVDVTIDDKLKHLSASDWRGALELLRKNIGKQIEIEHRGFFDKESHVDKVTVTEEMLDTWVTRVRYQPGREMFTQIEMAKIQEANPITAMMIGIRKTYYFIEQVYMMMKRMVITHSVGFEQVSGPIGIIKMGSDIAKHDFVKMLYFLALISANLAVINFLPLPIVDGGLFVFLIIEKIKGSPISIRVQVATQLIGLMLIIGIFLFVTIQDIQKLAG